MKRIAVIGSLNVDYVAYVDRPPKVGETVLSRSFQMVPGGKGANQAYAIGRMGGSVTMFGAVGRDGNAASELDNLRSAGVDVTHVAQLDAHTGIALISVGASGDNSIVVAQGANALVDRAYIDAHLASLAECDIIVFQLEIPLDTVVYAALKLKAMGKTILLDPAPAPHSLPDELLRNVDYLKPNETELATLTGLEGNLRLACGALLDKGVGCVLASRGEQGVLMAEPSGLRSFDAVRVRAVDTTAAGDSFTAAFAYGLSMDWNPEKAIRFAIQVAAVVVQRKGAQTSIPTHEEIRGLYAED